MAPAWCLLHASRRIILDLTCRTIPLEPPGLLRRDSNLTRPLMAVHRLFARPALCAWPPSLLPGAAVGQVGMPTETDEEIALAAAALQGKGVPNVLVTIGAGGSLLFRGGGAPALRQPCFAVDSVVDTTGAGDCFRGAFAACLAGGKTLGGGAADEAAALQLAAASSAHCVTVSPAERGNGVQGEAGGHC